MRTKCRSPNCSDLVEIRDVTYREVAKDAERSRIEASLEEAKITNISVVQPATRDLFPVFPNTRANLAVAFFASCFVSTGIAVLLDSRRQSKPSRRVSVNGSRVLRTEDLQATTVDCDNEIVLRSRWLYRSLGRAPALSNRSGTRG